MRRAAALLLAATGACGGATPSAPAPSPPPAPQATFTLVIAPDPIVSVETGNNEQPLSARWTVILQEQGGGSGNVNFINATLRDAATGAEAKPSGQVSLGAVEVIASAGTNHLSPRGRLQVEESLDYELPSGGRQGVLIVTVQFRDDSGRVFSQSARAEVE